MVLQKCIDNFYQGMFSDTTNLAAGVNLYVPYEKHRSIGNIVTNTLPGGGRYQVRSIAEIRVTS